MTYHSQRPNHAALAHGDEMRGVAVVVIDLEVFGNPLFDDEHLVAQGIRLPHQRGGGVDGNDLDHGPDLNTAPALIVIVGIVPTDAAPARRSPIAKAHVRRWLRRIAAARAKRRTTATVFPQSRQASVMLRP